MHVGCHWYAFGVHMSVLMGVHMRVSVTYYLQIRSIFTHSLTHVSDKDRDTDWLSTAAASVAVVDTAAMQRNV